MKANNSYEKKYVLYYRVSTKKQGDSGLGLESQKAILLHFLNPNDVVSEFTEVMSGGVKERPQLRAAIDLCKKHGYTLAVAKIDRLSRVTEDALSIYNELDKRLVSCDIPNLDKFTLTIFMAIADREKELIGIRTKAALQAKKDKGHVLGTKANLTKAGRQKAWKAQAAKAAKNENNMRAMMLICEYRNKGMTLQAIADKLNANGFKSSQGRAFQKVTVKRLYERYCQEV